MPDVALPAWLDRTAFPFRPRLVALGGGPAAPGVDEALSVTDVGAGPAVVFSHGTPTWSYEWRHHLTALSARHRCIAPDHLGFGLSPRPPGADYRPEAHARRFARLLERLGLERYHLVVHDFGGPFALDAALAHPERVASLTLHNTFAWPLGELPAARAAAWLAGTGAVRWAYGRLNLSFRLARSAWGSTAPLTPAAFAPYLPVFPDAPSRQRVLWALARSMASSAAYFASLWERRGRLAGTPVHLIWGLADPAFPPAALARFREAFPQATALELPGAGHWPHEEAPAVCVESLGRFLGSVG